jgi:hypothetical protein
MKTTDNTIQAMGDGYEIHSSEMWVSADVQESWTGNMTINLSATGALTIEQAEQVQKMLKMALAKAEMMNNMKGLQVN